MFKIIIIIALTMCACVREDKPAAPNKPIIKADNVCSYHLIEDRSLNICFIADIESPRHADSTFPLKPAIMIPCSIVEVCKSRRF